MPGHSACLAASNFHEIQPFNAFSSFMLEEFCPRIDLSARPSWLWGHKPFCCGLADPATTWKRLISQNPLILSLILGLNSVNRSATTPGIEGPICHGQAAKLN